MKREKSGNDQSPGSILHSSFFTNFKMRESSLFLKTIKKKKKKASFVLPFRSFVKIKPGKKKSPKTL